jgi:hypothetical protein
MIVITSLHICLHLQWGCLLLLGFNMGPVRPIGKAINFDADFDELMSNLEPALRQNVVQVRKTYDSSTQNQFCIGRVETGGYPLNAGFLLAAYRTLLRDQGFLKIAAAANGKFLSSLPDEGLAALSTDQMPPPMGPSTMIRRFRCWRFLCNASIFERLSQLLFVHEPPQSLNKSVIAQQKV